MKAFNLKDPVTRAQFARNLKKELQLPPDKFNIDNLWKTDRPGELLLDKRDFKTYSKAIKSIFNLFCPEWVYPEINKAMGEDEDNEKPDYAWMLWRLALFAPLAVDYKYKQKSKDTPPAEQPKSSKLTASKNTRFAKIFKDIKFSEVHELEDGELGPHLEMVVLFLDRVLSKMDGRVARNAIREFATALFHYETLDSEDEADEDQLNLFFDAHYTLPIQRFFTELISAELVVKSFSTKKMKISDLYEKYSLEVKKLNSSLANELFKGGFKEDSSVRIKIGNIEFLGLGVELKTSALGEILQRISNGGNPLEEINKLSEVFRQVTYYMINEKTQFFFISDFRFCFFFQYPLDNKIEWKDRDGSVVLEGPFPLRYKIIDNMSRSGTLTTQTLLCAKLFENLLAARFETIHGESFPLFVNSKERATIGPKGEITSEFETFVQKLLKAGLKGNKRTKPINDNGDDADDAPDDNDDNDNNDSNKRGPEHVASRLRSSKHLKTSSTTIVSDKSSKGTKNMEQCGSHHKCTEGGKNIKNDTEVSHVSHTDPDDETVLEMLLETERELDGKIDNDNDADDESNGTSHDEVHTDDGSENNSDDNISKGMKNGVKSNKRSQTASTGIVPGKSSESKSPEGTKNMEQSFSSIPESFLRFHAKKFELLTGATTRYAVKFVLPSSELFRNLESISTSTQFEELVFLKVFDMSHIEKLIYEVRHHNINPEWALESDRILIYDFAHDFDLGHRHLADSIAELSEENYQNELKAYHRIIEYNQSTTNPERVINCPQLLQYGYTEMKIDKEHYFEGHYLVFQYLPFVDKKPETAKEKKNLKQQIRNLERAGISHNDLEERNFCCDDDGKVYIFDYGNSWLEGEPRVLRW